MVGMNLGSVLKARGDLLAAEEVFRDNLAAKTRVLGSDHIDTCYAVLNLIGVWTDSAEAAGGGVWVVPTAAATGEAVSERDAGNSKRDRLLPLRKGLEEAGAEEQKEKKEDERVSFHQNSSTYGSRDASNGRTIYSEAEALIEKTHLALQVLYSIHYTRIKSYTAHHTNTLGFLSLSLSLSLSFFLALFLSAAGVW
jgi:hypothetical protein